MRSRSRVSSRQTRLQAILAGILLLCCCGTGQKPGGGLPPVVESKEELKLKSPITDLKLFYEAAKSEHERRAISLRAIDEGAIHRGAPVANVDGIFETHFAADLPAEKETSRRKSILFAAQFSPSPRPDGLAVAVSYIGWYLEVDYDHDGTIQNYYLSNLHKGLSRRTDGKEPMPIAELKRLYDAAGSEHERRDVALLAIDEGAIQIFGPVNVLTVDAIFGTHLGSQLPTKNDEAERRGIVDFAFPTPTGAPGQGEARESNAWFLAVEYYSDGNIANYFLTNVVQ